MLLENEALLFLIVLSLVGLVYGALKYDVRSAHKRITTAKETLNDLALEVAKVYVSREHLREILKPIHDSLERLHDKFDKANGKK